MSYQGQVIVMRAARKARLSDACGAPRFTTFVNSSL
jgi:hypothetical protein